MLALMVDLEDDPEWSTADESEDAETDRFVSALKSVLGMFHWCIRVLFHIGLLGSYQKYCGGRKA